MQLARILTFNFSCDLAFPPHIREVWFGLRKHWPWMFCLVWHWGPYPWGDNQEMCKEQLFYSPCITFTCLSRALSHLTGCTFTKGWCSASFPGGCLELGLASQHITKAVKTRKNCNPQKCWRQLAKEAATARAGVWQTTQFCCLSVFSRATWSSSRSSVLHTALHVFPNTSEPRDRGRNSSVGRVWVMRRWVKETAG